MRAGLLAAVMLCAGACASAPPASPTGPLRLVPLGINDGFHGPLPADIVAHYCGYGVPFTIRTPHLTGETLDAFVASTWPCSNLKTLALVEGPDMALAQQLASHAGVDQIEIGNELELEPHELPPASYAAFIGSTFHAIRAVNPTVTIIMGGVYTLNADTKARILAAMQVCPGCWVGIHLYEDLTRDDLDWLRSLSVPIAVTETGSPTGCGRAKWQEQADWIQSRIAILSTVPNVALIVVYQRPSASSCDNLATFGLQDVDGTWKTADRVFSR